MHESIGAWVRTIATGIAVLFTYLVVWQIWLIVDSRGRKAYGLGYYQAQAPVFYVIGLLFIAFGLFLHLRR